MSKLTAVAIAMFTTFALACGSADNASDDATSEDALAAKACGGFAGLHCPSSATCVEDPSDSCDPAAGGRDCSGICVDATKAKACGGFAGFTCSAGYACVDDPRDSCDPLRGGRDCGGLCARVMSSGGAKPTHCGGFAGTLCLGGAKCVDDPSDSCDPTKGGRDCLGICVEASDAGAKADAASGAAKGKFCGGFAGIQCQTGLSCVDDPSDACDPKKGGADCGGICQ